MDLDTITEVVRQPSDRPCAEWREGDAWLAGGTWLFSAEQPDLRRLVDLTALHWEPLVPTERVRTNLVGLGIVAAVMVFWAAVFYAVTTLIWTLP